MKISSNVAQHLPAAAVCDTAVLSWDGVVTSGFVVAAAHADATRSAKTRTATTAMAVAPTGVKRTAPFPIRTSSPPV